LSAQLDRTSSAAVFGVVFLVYLFTASLHGPVNGDTYAAAVPAWRIATAQTVLLGDTYLPLHVPFQVETPAGAVTDRQPGVVLTAVPIYWIAARLGAGEFTLAPAGLTAALVSALSIAVLHRVFRRIASPQVATVAALVAAFATSSWSISADALWPHGPGQLWLAVSLLSMAGARHARTGLSLAAAILVRPVTAVMALSVGVGAGLAQRRCGPTAVIGAASSIGLVALLVYNRAVFGAASVSGGYAPTFVDNLWTMSATDFGLNVLGTFFSLSRGLLPYSPFLLVLGLGLRAAWKTSPGWVRSGGLAGAVYLLVQLRMNRFSGGHGFYGYRYPLEALTMAAPLLLRSWQEWVRPRRGAGAVFAALVAVSVYLQWLGAAAWFNSKPETDFWWDCGPCEAVRIGGWPVVLVGCAALAGLLLWYRVGSERSGGSSGHSRRRMGSPRCDLPGSRRSVTLALPMGDVDAVAPAVSLGSRDAAVGEQGCRRPGLKDDGRNPSNYSERKEQR